MSRNGVLGGCVAGALAALAMGAGTAGAVDASVVATYDTPSAPDDVRFAFGAAWADAGTSLVRMEPGGGAPTTTTFPGPVVDFTEGYGRMWVLWHQGARHYLASVNPSTGRIVGAPRRTSLPGKPAEVQAGAGGVWASGTGMSFRRMTTVSRVNPRTGRALNRRWSRPRDFFVEKGLLWSFEGLRLVKRAPGDLRTRGSVKAFSGYNAITFGLGNFWTSSLGPTDEGGVTRISPTTGRGPVVYSFPGGYDAGGIVTGAGQVWVASQNNDGGPWNVGGFTAPDGTPTTQNVDLPNGPSGEPSLAYGASTLWVTDPSGERVLQITPPS